MMKYILTLMATLLFAYQLKSQVPSNVSKPFSETNNIIIDMNAIHCKTLERPNSAIKNAIGNGVSPFRLTKI